MSDRRQCVCVNNVVSSSQLVTCGVPQGSILGPLLFIIYFNDIVNCSRLIYFIIFADDTTLFFSAPKLESLISIINSELSNVDTWFKVNKLSLNTQKTKFMLFGSKAKPSVDGLLNVYINGVKIEQVSHVKFLGVLVDEKLSWKHHISSLSSILSRNIGILSRVRYKLPVEAMVLLYNTLILPYLNYCNIVWGGANKSNLDQLIKLQKRQ